MAISAQDDLLMLLRELGISDHARPVSPHEVFITEVIPAVQRFKNASEYPPNSKDCQRRCWTVRIGSNGASQCNLFNGHSGEHYFGSVSDHWLGV